jgi:phytol kinase
LDAPLLPYRTMSLAGFVLSPLPVADLPSLASIAGWSPRLPPLATTLWLAPAILAFLLLLGAALGRLKMRHGVRTGYTRKMFHFAVFATATVLAHQCGVEALNLLGIAGGAFVALALWLGEGNPLYEALARESDAPHRSLFVVLPYVSTALGGILATSLFGSYSIVGYAVTGTADAIAEPVGLRWGRHPYRVPSFGLSRPAHRTVEGSAAVFLTALLASVLVLPLVASPALAPRVGIALSVALASTAVEAVSHHGLDNLTIQLAASGCAWAIVG